MPVIDNKPRRKTSAYYGRIGGRSRSEAKQAAARENGKRGGRPRTKQLSETISK